MQDRSRPIQPLAWCVFLSLLLHLVVFIGLSPYWDAITSSTPRGDAIPVTLLLEVPEPKTPDLEELNQASGQLVDVPRPEMEERPDKADFVAEYDRVVEEETRTRDFRINPEILSEIYSEDDQLQFEDLIDLNIKDPSTGARPGLDAFDPDRDGRLASLPSPFQVTNKEGLQRPVPASTTSAVQAGAPNNDMLDVEIGRAVNLNTKEILGASYYNRIRRLVNFYWKQNIDNLPSSLPLSKSRYATAVDVVLDTYGALETIRVTQGSGSEPIDKAVVDAFRIAGPFPNPPSQLVESDGRVYLPDFEFTVHIGMARAPYVGVDPRQGVQFPGILKTTR